MPTIIRKTQTLLLESRRKTHTTLTWHERSNLWRPPTDVFETETAVVVRVEIAGIRDEDIELIIQGDLLLISGTRVDSSERRAYHQMEISFGKFSIGVELPASVITENATAEYKDGFLTINLTKEKLDT